MPTLQSIQLMRFLAAILVVVLHVFNFSKHYISEFDSINPYYFNFGNAGVHIFFVISGFVIIYVNSKNFGQQGEIKTYLIKRFVRIFPIYIVLALANLVIRLMVGLGETPDLGTVISALLLIPPHASALIFIGWSLSYEIYFYLLFAPMLLLPLHRAVPVLSALLFGLAAIGLLSAPADPRLAVATNTLLLEFAFGALIAWAVVQNRIGPVWFAYLMLLNGVALFALGVVAGFDRGPTAIVWGVPAAMVLFGVIALERHGLGEGVFRRFGRLGDSSYALYLSHAMVIPPVSVLFGALFPVGGFWAAVPIYGALVLLCLGVALGVHRYLELPLTRRVGRWAGTRPPMQRGSKAGAERPIGRSKRAEF